MEDLLKKRVSIRQTKKPRILDEYIIDSRNKEIEKLSSTNSSLSLNNKSITGIKYFLIIIFKNLIFIL